MTSPTPRTWARWLRRPSTPPPRCPPHGAPGCPPSPTCPGAFQVKTTLDLQAQPAAGVGLGCRAGPAVSAPLTANSPSEAGGQGSHSCKPGLLNYGASKGLNLNWAREPASPPDMASFAKMTLSAPKVQSCWINCIPFGWHCLPAGAFSWGSCAHPPSFPLLVFLSVPNICLKANLQPEGTALRF